MAVLWNQQCDSSTDSSIKKLHKMNFDTKDKNTSLYIML